MPEPQPLRALLIDDEPLAVERLQILCARVSGPLLAGTANDGAGALRMIEAPRPDLLLMDIQMPGLDGIAVANALQGAVHRPAIIFVTAYDQFAVAAFDVAAVDYLLKPVEQERLERAIDRVRGQLEAPHAPSQSTSQWTQEFWVPHRAEVIRVAVKDIDLIEAERDYMRIHVGPRSYLMHQTITDLERKLDPAEFLRIHRSTIVRRDKIKGFKHNAAGAWEAQLEDGRSMRVGRSYLANARAMAGR